MTPKINPSRPPSRPPTLPLRTPPAPPSPPPPPASGKAQANPPRPAPHVEPDILILSRARTGKLPVTVTLKSGKTITGLVVRWGLYAFEVEANGGSLLLYKSAIESIALA